MNTLPRIAIVCSGLMDIPASNWGAIERVAWNHYQQLLHSCHDVIIVNTSEIDEIKKLLSAFSPDIVHVHYESYLKVALDSGSWRLVFTTHNPYFPQIILLLSSLPLVIRYPLNKIFSMLRVLMRIRLNKFAFSLQYAEYIRLLTQSSRIYFACLSTDILKKYNLLGVPEKRTFLLPNFFNENQVVFHEDILFPDNSLYLARIEPRKRQHLLYDIASVMFVGPASHNYTLPPVNQYLGSWTSSEVHQTISHFANLVLISEAEAHPLVCIEALLGGLGLVLSEASAANLDRNLPFITVIPESDLCDSSKVYKAIAENRQISLASRFAIREYGIKNFICNNSFYLSNLYKKCIH